MSFYWVNLGGSYKEVAEFKFLWAPAYTLNANNRKVVDAGWKHVPEVRKNDIIFCHEDGRIIYVAVAKTDAFSSERPENRTFQQWKREGFRIDVDLVILDVAISTIDFKDTLFRLYNERCSPRLFTVKQHATQNYMISIPDGAGALLLDAIGEVSIIVQAKASQTKSADSNGNATERESLIKSRVGQGKFRKDVLLLWNGVCPVTGIDLPDLLIASHILPWQLANDSERLDKFNGLLLSPSIDKLFDKGYISFSNEGKLLVNKNLPEDTLRKLGIDINKKLYGLHNNHLSYLKLHRSIFGFPADKS